jgi:hypothetical protein
LYLGGSAAQSSESSVHSAKWESVENARHAVLRVPGRRLIAIRENPGDRDQNEFGEIPFPGHVRKSTWSPT